MRQILALAAAITLGAAAFAPAQAQQSPAAGNGASQAKISKASQEFINKAAITDMFEIKAGDLAQQKADDDSYKQFGKMISDDHKKADDQLKSIAQKIPGTKMPADVDAAHKKILDKLQAASGAKFENEFKSAQVQGHQQGIKLFQDYAQKGDNADLKKFAQDTLPTLQKHLQQAQALPKGGAAPTVGSAPSKSNAASGSSTSGKSSGGSAAPKSGAY